MTFLRGRRVTSACMVAVAVAAFAPSVASAKKAPKGSVCSGASITGQGAGGRSRRADAVDGAVQLGV